MSNEETARARIERLRTELRAAEREALDEAASTMNGAIRRMAGRGGPPSDTTDAGMNQRIRRALWAPGEQEESR